METTRLRAAELMDAPASLHGLNLVSALLRLSAEREPQAALYAAARGVLDALHASGPAALGAAATAMVRFELAVLAESGFGLDLSSCAATERTDDLAYVSPRSSRAVSREAGAPYRDRLLALPPFLLAEPGPPICRRAGSRLRPDRLLPCPRRVHAARRGHAGSAHRLPGAGAARRRGRRPGLKTRRFRVVRAFEPEVAGWTTWTTTRPRRQPNGAASS